MPNTWASTWNRLLPCWSIFSHTYILTGYFPVCLSHVFSKALTRGINSIADVELSSFYNFVDTFKADALRICAAGYNCSSWFQQVVIPLLSRLQYNGDVAALLPKVALLVKPHFALSKFCRGMNLILCLGEDALIPHVLYLLNAVSNFKEFELWCRS